MAKLFYDHLIIIEEVIAVLDKKRLPKAEQEKLLAVIDETLHNHILDVILTHLPKSHHEEFLLKLTHHPFDVGILPFLQERTQVNIEQEILKTAQAVKEVLIKQIHQTA